MSDPKPTLKNATRKLAKQPGAQTDSKISPILTTTGHSNQATAGWDRHSSGSCEA